jgi:hypothetical protein
MYLKICQFLPVHAFLSNSWSKEHRETLGQEDNGVTYPEV